MKWVPGASAAAPVQGHKENAGNALVEEMRVLDGVLREVISAIALGDGARVQAAIEQMHGKLEKTQEALKHGAVKLKKNAQRLDDFVRQDEEFHASLESLAETAGRNDRPAMLSAAKKLLDACVRCHQDFR